MDRSGTVRRYLHLEEEEPGENNGLPSAGIVSPFPLSHLLKLKLAPDINIFPLLQFRSSSEQLSRDIYIRFIQHDVLNQVNFLPNIIRVPKALL